MTPETPIIFSVGLCFTRGDETPKGVKEAFPRTDENGHKIDDLIKTLIAYSVYESGNKTIMLKKMNPHHLEAMMEELRAAQHGKTVSFIEDAFNESDCTDWCIVVMETQTPGDEFQRATIDAL